MSQKTHKIDYSALKGGMHDDFSKSKNPVRSWFHKSRFSIINNLVKKYHAKNSVIIDLACGTPSWNSDRMDIYGFDINSSELVYAVQRKYLKSACRCDITKLSVKKNSVDIAILSEILEHLEDYEDVVRDVHSVLKPGGKIIVTVPYDTNLSLWKPLFKMLCFFYGNIRGKEYFKKEAGHINHFSPKDVEGLLSRAGFKVIEQFDNKRFTIFTVAEKQ